MSIPAIAGGAPVRTDPFPSWPVYGGEESVALARVLESGVWGTRGPEVAAFEDEFAKLVGTRHAVGVCNGTVSLECALRAFGVGPGDEVIVPAYTFVATASSVLMVGATPIFADVDPETACMAPPSFEAVITPRTKAVIPVHLAGCPADLDAIGRTARRHGIRVLEDCAQAHGASWNGAGVGTIGDAGSFSFQNSKNLTSGEGGAITTSDTELADACWAIHNIGRVRSGEFYEHFVIASNLRMSEWQAAILRAQMSRFDAQRETRESAAAYLDSELGAIEGLTPMQRDSRVTSHAHHLYLFTVNSEELGGLPKRRFIDAMCAEGIPCSAGYTPLNHQPMLRSDGARRILAREIDYLSLDVPGTRRLCEQVVWIPQNVLLARREDLSQVVEAARKIVSHREAVSAAGA